MLLPFGSIHLLRLRRVGALLRFEDRIMHRKYGGLSNDSGSLGNLQNSANPKCVWINFRRNQPNIGARRLPRSNSFAADKFVIRRGPLVWPDIVRRAIARTYKLRAVVVCQRSQFKEHFSIGGAKYHRAHLFSLESARTSSRRPWNSGTFSM